jgi:hypothetical protein
VMTQSRTFQSGPSTNDWEKDLSNMYSTRGTLAPLRVPAYDYNIVRLTGSRAHQLVRPYLLLSPPHLWSVNVIYWFPSY